MKNIGLYVLLLLAILLVTTCKKDDNNNGNKNEPYDKPVTSIALSGDIVWVGTAGNGLYKLEDGTWSNLTTSDGLPDDNIQALAADQQGRLWIGMITGLSSLDNGNWTHFTTENGLLSNNVKSIFCDSGNLVWIGTGKNGLSCYEGSEISSIQVGTPPGGMGHIHCISNRPGGDLWVGSCINGLSVFDGETWDYEVNGLTVFVNACSYSENGDVWVGHTAGIDRFADETWTRFSETDGLADDYVTCIAADTQGNMWIGTTNGLSFFNGSAWTTYTTDDGLAGNAIIALACDQGNLIWVGSSNGLVRLEY